MNRPFVSIVLPIRNESLHIEKTMAAICAQDYPVDRMEILLVDGMSTDGTQSIICDFAARYSQMRIVVLDNPGKIVPTGLNIALHEARGEIIIRVDGHTSIAPNYVRQCVEALYRTKADNVGGRMTALGDNPFGKGVALATSSPFGIGGGRFHYSEKEEWVDTVYMGAWPRRVFDKIGLFDEELVRDQDDEFNYRLRSVAGGRILLDPKIKSEYIVRSSPAALWSQYYQYGFWKVRVLQKHPLQMRLRQFAPPVFSMALLGSALLAFSPTLRFLSPGVPLLYLIVNFIVTIWMASRHGWRYLLLLPFIFSILHLSYGLGFLVGIIKFLNRWGDRTGKVPSWSNETFG